MSKETLEHLNNGTLIGYTEKRGNAWHYREDLQGGESNHYQGSIPVEDVHRRLFNWKAIEGQITATALTDDGVMTTTDPERKAIMRSDTGAILGIFKSGYRPHQYDEWLIGNVGSILDADLQIGSAGLLRGGAQAWVQIEMEETLSVAGVDFRPFLTAATSLDGSLATTYITGAQVVVCDNTLSAALGGSDRKLKIYHSVNSMQRLQDARAALGIVYDVADAFTEQVNRLTDETVSDSRWAQFVDAYSNPTAAQKPTAQMVKKAETLQNLWTNDLRVQPWAGTAFGVVQAVNTYVHHLQTVRGETRSDRNAGRVIEGKVDELDRSTLQLLARFEEIVAGVKA